MSAISPGCAGSQPRCSRVSALDAGLSIETSGARKLRWRLASQAVRLTAGELQLAADGLGDVPERHPLLGDRVQSRARRGGFHGQPEHGRRVKPVHGGPAVRSVAYIGRHALLASDADQGRVVLLRIQARGHQQRALRRRADARTEIFFWLNWYNRTRLHSTIGNRPPVECEQHLAQQLLVACPVSATRGESHQLHSSAGGGKSESGQPRVPGQCS
jgi:hypothetical protein